MVDNVSPADIEAGACSLEKPGPMKAAEYPCLLKEPGVTYLLTAE